MKERMDCYYDLFNDWNKFWNVFKICLKCVFEVYLKCIEIVCCGGENGELNQSHASLFNRCSTGYRFYEEYRMFVFLFTELVQRFYCWNRSFKDISKRCV